MSRFPEELVEKTRTILEELHKYTDTLVLAAVLSDDGFELARTPAEPTDSDGRFASMASSVQALSEAVADDRDLGKNDSVTIQAAKGRLIQLRIRNSYVLSALFTNKELQGRNLIDLRKVAVRLKPLLM